MEIKLVSDLEDFRSKKEVTLQIGDYFFHIKMNKKHKREVWSFWKEGNEDFTYTNTGDIRGSQWSRNQYAKEVAGLEIVDRPTCKKLLLQVGNFLKKLELENIAYWDEVTEEEEEDSSVKKVSSVVVDDVLYEQVYDKENGVRFVYLDPDKVPRYVPEVCDGDFTFVPVDDIRDLENNLVRLPEKPEDYGTFEALVQQIEAHIRKWLDVNENFLKIAVYSIPFYWLYDRFNVLHYLRARGDTGSGKSRFLDTIGGLSYKPIMVAGAITTAPIFRVLNKWKGTLIIDEADFHDSTEKNEVITILNCGYEKSRPVIRADVDQQDGVITYDVYSPKIIATRQAFKDKALESRCVTNIMRSTLRRDIPFSLEDDFFKEQQSLRNQLLMYRLENWNTTKKEKHDFDMSKIEPRLQQITGGILSVIKDVNVRKTFLDFLHKMNEDIIDERSESYEGLIINVIHTFLEEHKKSGLDGELYISSKSIVDKMLELEMVSQKKAPKPVTIGRILKSLGVETKVKKVDGKAKRILIFDEILFHELFRRYIPNYSQNLLRLRKVTAPIEALQPTLTPIYNTVNSPNITPLSSRVRVGVGGSVRAVTTVTETSKKPPKNTLNYDKNSNIQKVYDLLQIVSEIRKKDRFIQDGISDNDLVAFYKKKGIIQETTPGQFIFV